MAKLDSAALATKDTLILVAIAMSIAGAIFLIPDPGVTVRTMDMGGKITDECFDRAWSAKQEGSTVFVLDERGMPLATFKDGRTMLSWQKGRCK